MSTRDKAEWALAVYEKTIRDSMATHYLNDNATEEERHAARQAVHDAREQAVSCLCPTPPAPDGVRLTLSREQAEGVSRDLHYWIGHWGGLSFESIEALSVVDAALEAAAAPGAAR